MDTPSLPPARNYRSRLPWWEGSLRVCLVLGMVLALPLVGLALAFANVGPTPTQAALAGWLVWAVPITALFADRLTSPGPRVFLAVLLGGWALVLPPSALAALIFRGYPVSGPHELVALLTFALAATCHLVWCTIVTRSAGRRAMRLMHLAVLSLAISGGSLAWVLFADPVVAELPLSAYPIRRHTYSDFAGGNAVFVQAPLDDAAFRQYARALGATAREEPSDRAPRNALGTPDWFVLSDAKEVWYDPRRRSNSTREAWCWTVAAWDGTKAWASSGCGWM